MLVWFALSLLTIAVQAQSVPQVTRRGLIVNDQETYIFDAPGNRPGPDACMNQREETMLQVLVRTAPNAGFKLPIASATPCAEFEAWMQPLPDSFIPSVAGGFGTVERSAARTTLQRFVRDDVRHIYASYAVTIESLPEARAYRVSFSASAPPSLEEGWRAISPAQFPVPQIMREGEELPIELDAGSSGGIELIDYVRVGRHDEMPQRKGAPGDFYAGDAEFSLSQPRLSVNGLDASTLPETIHGAALWLYAPGYGRILLSLGAHADPGFKRIGETSGNSMTLILSGTVFRVTSRDRIAAGGGIYNVYARQDPGWRPEKSQDQAHFLIGAAPAPVAPR